MKPTLITMSMLALATPNVSNAQSVARAETENEDAGKLLIAVAGGGGLTADAVDFDAKKIHGQVAVDIQFPNRLSLALSFNATNKIGDTVQSDSAAIFGSQIVNQDLGPYSFGLNFQGNRLYRNTFGFYTYGQLSAVTWTLADENIASPEGVPSYSATPYAFGGGLNICVKENVVGNSFNLELGAGIAGRGVGGNIALNDRLSNFIGTNKSTYVSPEFRALLNINAMRASVSVFYFGSTQEVDGLSELRFIISVGAAGDIIKFQ
ncbi:MAG: hypothetical protein EOO71_05580 [Myxococcaceae bacterium]|nr:MAG: hypothetical protein EOO71_05580 [Myxococcaceae bacterium]